VLAAVAAAIRVTMGPPILFRQTRPGRGGRPFVILKFRTMTSLSDHEGRPLPNWQRTTRLGYWLRRLSLDELPELWNVLTGDMSLVGPRPLLMEYLPRYSPEQARRHEVKPGVTGLAQIRGRHALDWSERFELDTWYVDHCSLRLDAEIILGTFSVLLGGQANLEPSAEPFPFGADIATSAAGATEHQTHALPSDPAD
jgi:lipopolysaccharide/colanic/teichoic acid biosynthesis glycosyltransferase